MATDNDHLQVLLVGETWVTHTLHIKGMDTFTQSGYGDGSKWLRRAVERSGGTFHHMPAHAALTDFPNSAAELAAYDVVVLSDVGANTLLLHPDTSVNSVALPNRLEALAAYVKAGGGLIMVGGYMSFQGIHGMARYSGTPVEEVLPVSIHQYDDRVEAVDGFAPNVSDSRHPVTAGLPETFPTMLFRNDVTLKDGADLLLETGGHVVLATWEIAKGRTAAFTCDIAPHGAPPEFLEWAHFDDFWWRLLNWVAFRSLAEANQVAAVAS